MQDLTPRGAAGAFSRAIVHAQSQVPGGAASTQPGALPRTPQDPGSKNQADNNDTFTDGVLDAEVAPPKLVNSVMEGGNMVKAPETVAGEMTAPGSQPASPMPTAYVAEHLGPDSELPQLPVNTPEKPPEHAGIPDKVTRFARHTFGKVDGGADPWKRVRR